MALPSLVTAAPPTPSAPYTECPAVGDDTSCGILIQVTDDGNTILADPGQGPFDGDDDTLVGVLNSSSEPVARLNIASDTDVFGFDGDGICSGDYDPAPPGCPFGPTGYEGPNTSFANISPSATGGTVVFATPLAPGQTAYFSLEEALSATTVVAGGPSADQAGGAPNPALADSPCDSGEPVNCATGEFWRTFTDFSVPGRGVSLDLARTYVSADAGTDGSFGFGWTDSYGMSATTDSGGVVTIHQENGSTLEFTPDGTGGFTAPSWVLATLVSNPDGTLTFSRDADHVQDVFSAAGQLLSETDLNGEKTTLAYAGSLLTSVTDPAGRTLTFSYTGAHVSKVTDPMGRATTYAYDAAGNLASVTDAAGRTWSFGYDPNHLLLSMTDPRGGITTNSYDGSGRVVTQTAPRNGTTTWAYAGDAVSPGGGTTTITDPNGDVTTQDYANLELTSVTQGTGTSAQATTTYTHDPATLATTSVTDPDGHTTTNVYDADANLLSTTDPLGRTTSYEYNALNEVTAMITPLGETTTLAYDPAGNLLSSTDALGQVTTFAHGNAAHPGDITAVTDPDGRVRAFTYDAQGDVTSTAVTPAAGVSDTSDYVYDADGEKVCAASGTATAAHISCPAPGAPRVAGTTTTVYNADGEPVSVTDPDGHTTSTAYDVDGNTISTTDPDGNLTSYTYDADNEVTAVKRADGTSLAVAYDPDGDLISQANGAGNVTAYAYDSLRRLVSTTDPLKRVASYGYDPAGNQTSLTDPSGRTTTTAYDAANEPVAVSYSDAATPGVQLTYDGDGERATMTDGTGTSTYAYDADERLTSSTDGAGAHVAYGYDPAGDLTTLTYPNGQSVTRTYNGAGQLATIKDWLGNTTAVGYDADGNTATMNYPNGVQVAAAYDGADQLASIIDTHSATTLAKFVYGRDADGQVISDAETGIPAAGGAPVGPVTYTYNALNQLASSNGSAYSYNQADSLTRLPNGTTQTYDPASELLSTTGPAGSAGSPSVDQVVNGTEEKSAAPVTSPPVTTKSGGELILAFISADGPSGQQQKVTAVTGGGLTWALASRADMVKGTGTAEVWQAYATNPLQSATIKASLKFGPWDGAITIATFTGAAPAVGATADDGARKGAPSVTLTTTKPGSLVLAAGHNWSHAAAETPAAGQSIVTQDLDTRVNDTYWVQKTVPVLSSGTAVSVADTAPLDGRWELAAVEVLPAPGASGSGATSYSYDKQGNRTAAVPAGGSTATLTYDQANRLSGYATTGTVATYAYNGDGLRAAKTVNGTTTPFTWDLSASTPLLLSGGTTSYIYGPDGHPIEQITGTTPTYLLGDQQGSTRLLADAAGIVAGTYTYSPYGQTLGHTGAASTPLQYDGQYTDAETGYQYLRARSYDPATGQFLSRDPLAALTGSPYGFASENPLTLGDPSGLCPKQSCDELLAAMTDAADKISTKANELITNPLNLPLYGSKSSVQSHINPFTGYQTNLKNLIGQYVDGDCGDVPDDILEQAERPVPVDVPPLPQPGQQSSFSPYDSAPSGNTNWGQVIERGAIIVGGAILIGGFIYATGGAGALVFAF